MAWNEPGGNKDKDPWGQKGADQGPPDLDEAFRKLQSQLAGIFGGRTGGSGGGGAGSTSVNPRTLLFVLLGAVVVYTLSGLYQIDQQERGVVFRFGAVKSDVVMPGLHWYPRFIDTVQPVNVTRVNSIKHQALMLTKDENIVDVTLTVQYVIDNPIDFATKVRDPESSLENAAESALRHVVGSTEMDNVITEGRAAIAVEVGERFSGLPEAVRGALDELQEPRGCGCAALRTRDAAFRPLRADGLRLSHRPGVRGVQRKFRPRGRARRTLRRRRRILRPGATGDRFRRRPEAPSPNSRRKNESCDLDAGSAVGEREASQRVMAGDSQIARCGRTRDRGAR